MRASDGKNVRVYTARESAPMIEDVGVSHLCGGRVHVAIDSALQRAMSHESTYHVFPTPDGPSHGVNPGGQSSTVDAEAITKAKLIQSDSILQTKHVNDLNIQQRAKFAREAAALPSRR